MDQPFFQGLRTRITKMIDICTVAWPQLGQVREYNRFNLVAIQGTQSTKKQMLLEASFAKIFDDLRRP